MSLPQRAAMLGFALALLAGHPVVTTVVAQGAGHWSSVDSAFGRPSVAHPGDVMKWSFPRSDLAVVVEGVAVKPALGGWVAMKDVGHGQAMAMGDLVLAPDEVNDVIRTLQDGGVEQTALHNHLLAPVIATAINFQPTGGGKAAITGDFVLLAKEVNPVIRALTEHGIKVEAVHSHMLFESPRLYFAHFWANDDAVTLAKGLHAALDLTASAKASVR